jgi:peroxiredoxin
LVNIISIFNGTKLFAGDTPATNIRVSIKGIKPGATLLLANYYSTGQYIQDSAQVDKNGFANFQRVEKYPEGIYLMITPDKKYFDFIMDKEQNFSIKTDSSNFVKTMSIKGSQENLMFNDYQNFMFKKQSEVAPLKRLYENSKNKDSVKYLQDQISKIDNEVKKFRSQLISNHPNSFVAKVLNSMTEPEIPKAPELANGKKDTTFAYYYFKNHFFDHIDFSDERLLRTPIFAPKLKQYMDKLTPQIPDSISVSAQYLAERAKVNHEMFKYVVSWLTYTYESSKIMGMDAVFVDLVDKYYKTKQVDWLDSTRMHKILEKGYILKPLLIGKTAPAITMTDSSGINRSLYDIKSKYTVIIFWDHACGHCKKEIPKLNELYKSKLKARGVGIYSVETEGDVKEWKKFVKEHGLDWVNVIEKDDYKRAVTKKYYDIYSTPVIYLLDENKVIRAKRIESEQLEEVINNLEKHGQN